MTKKAKQKKSLSLFFFILMLIGCFFYIKKTYTNYPLNHTFNETQTPSKKENQLNKQLVLIIFKQEKQLELRLNNDTGSIFTQLYDININEEVGPKLFNGDNYFPEGKYFVTEIGKNNLKINFPNAYDLGKAKADNRQLIPEDILFYQANLNNQSLLKKEDIIEIIQLARREKIKDIQLISVPIDFRKQSLIPYCHRCPHWINELYSQLELELKNSYSQQLD